MMIPIGPIVGIAARAIASRAATRAAAGAATRTVAGRAMSASQLGRGASVLGRVGRGAMAVGRGAALMSAFTGTTASNATSEMASSPDQSTGPTKKQGLDTYGDSIY